ncbi:MAG: YjbQ family protein, partial [Thermodesulfobacteriota bacterium]
MNFSGHIELSAKGFCDIIDITDRVEGIVTKAGVTEGIVTVFVPGSTASISTIEYEDGVVEDLKEAIEQIAPS